MGAGRISAEQSVLKNDALYRYASSSDNVDDLASIYRDDINLAVWLRELTDELKQAVDAYLEKDFVISARYAISTDNSALMLDDILPSFDGKQVLVKDMAWLIEMFGFLFDLKQVGMRFSLIDNAMCPRFHVDRVLCRLVTSYRGVGTQWLDNQSVDRSKLGTGNNGLPDNESGLYHSEQAISQLKVGDVALLKGDSWNGDNQGIVHRSPPVPDGEKRLLMTLDFL